MNDISTARREGFVEADDRRNPPFRPAVAGVAPVPSPAPQVTEPEPVPEPEPIVEDIWPVKVKLVHSKNIRNHRNEYIDALTFRAPTGGDINRYGNPCRFNQDGELIFDERKMTQVMAALSGVLPPVIRSLDARDWASAAYRLRPFFLPEPGLAWV